VTARRVDVRVFSSFGCRFTTKKEGRVGKELAVLNQKKKTGRVRKSPTWRIPTPLTQGGRANKKSTRGRRGRHPDGRDRLEKMHNVRAGLAPLYLGFEGGFCRDQSFPNGGAKKASGKKGKSERPGRRFAASLPKNEIEGDNNLLTKQQKKER